MVTSYDVLKLMKELSLTERLLIVEETLRNIREESSRKKVSTEEEPTILKLAGIIDQDEASVFKNAIEESRKVDINGW